MQSLPLSAPQLSLNPEVLARDWIARSTTRTRSGVHALHPITRQLAERKGRSTLPHEEGDHTDAGRGWRGGWRAPHERRQLVPWAQEAERIGVPAPHHRGGPG